MSEQTLSIAQVVEITGLPASTIRYYDQQLGEYLGIQRGKGRRRDFSQESIGMIQKVHAWLKEEALSIRQVRVRLGGSETEASKTPNYQELDTLRNEIEVLRHELDELKDIQQKVLNILTALTC